MPFFLVHTQRSDTGLSVMICGPGFQSRQDAEGAVGRVSAGRAWRVIEAANRDEALALVTGVSRPPLSPPSVF
jgi:hypothetical protein